ncbi:MAG: cytidylate kinase-like family protein [Calditrichae bacterium]|nr:cytidylate kinase-like family protein [Calditrichota bacterium]MCB9057492.1 cytidylate kinase-like family protein [Calditrichia bacterium]
MFKLNKQVPIENLISKQISFWETSHKTTTAKKSGLFPNITISREPGSRGGYLSQQLAKRLNWKIFGREIVEYIAHNTHIHKDIIKLFDERSRNDIENLISTLINSQQMSNEMYLKQLAKTIITLGRHSNAIILGRGANFILPDSMAFKIRVVEDFDQRLHNILNNENMLKIDAKKLKQEQEEQASFIVHNFKSRIDDATHYDLIINLSKSDLQTAEDIIIAGLCRKYNLSEEDLAEGVNIPIRYE